MKVKLTEDFKKGTIIEVSEELIKSNPELFEEVKENVRWKPKMWENYYSINSYGYHYNMWKSDMGDLGNDRVWNCYKTEEEIRVVISKTEFIIQLIDKYWYLKEGDKYFFFDVKSLRYVNKKIRASKYTYLQQKTWFILHWESTKYELEEMINLIKKSEWI